MNGISHIPFAVVLERGIDAVHRAKESVPSEPNVNGDIPSGTLAHHSTLVKTIADAVANVDIASTSALTDDTDGFDRIALEIARRHASRMIARARERPRDVALDELIAMLLSRAATPDTEPAMRSARFKSKPNAMTIDVVGSLALVRGGRFRVFASSTATRRVDLTRPPPHHHHHHHGHHHGHHVPIPPVLTTDVTKRALLRRRADKLGNRGDGARWRPMAAILLPSPVASTPPTSRCARGTPTQPSRAPRVHRTCDRRRVAGVVDAPLAAW